MSAKRFEIILATVMIFALSQKAAAESARALVNEANKLHTQGKFNEAINKYDQALTENPDAAIPKFNKADSYYRLDDLVNAMSAYEEVAAKSKDMRLVAKAKYNLGNSFFHRGSKQRDSDLQKAIDDFKTSISYWRSALDIEPDNEKAAKNIEVARLTIKDLLDQLNKQKDANQPQDPNQQQKQQQENKDQQKSQDGQQNQQQKQDENKQQDSANKSQDKQQEQKQQEGQQKEPNKPPDANQPKQQDEQQKKENQQEAKVPEATSQEILDKEQKQRQERQMMQRGQYQKVDKDW